MPQFQPSCLTHESVRSLTDEVRGYIAAMLFANTFHENERGELDSDCSAVEDAVPSKETIRAARADVACFLQDCMADDAARAELERYRAENGDEHVGHDFALTRNRHGSGFWDRGDFPTLTRIAHNYGTNTWCVDKRGKATILEG